VNTFNQYNIPRHKILIATKIKHLVVEDDIDADGFGQPALRDQRDYVNQDGLSRAAIFNAVDASLRRLDTPYIDLLQIHRADPATPIEETMKALHNLVQSGKVRYIGASSVRTWRFVKMNHVAEKSGWTKFVSMQLEYSLLYREEVRINWAGYLLTADMFDEGARDDPVLLGARHRTYPLGPACRRSARAPPWRRDRPFRRGR
jgi:aryl-alcohol dehydrogenase-like predicted oxidoreductase